MPHKILFASLASLLLLGIVPLAAASDPQRPQPIPYELWEPKEGSVYNYYCGTVSEVTKDSITIQWTATLGVKPKTFGASETLVAGKIPMVPRLQPGARHAYKVEPEYMYRLKDVEAGDLVAIFYARVNSVDICDHVCIVRRPDGLIPPLQKEAEDLRNGKEIFKAMHPNASREELEAFPPYTPYHERWNAYWAKVAPMPREKGALPAKIMQ